MDPTSPPGSLHTWTGVESLIDLDTARVTTLLTAAISGVEQRGGSVAGVGLAPFVLPEGGTAVLCWLLWRDPTGLTDQAGARSTPSSDGTP